MKLPRSLAASAVAAVVLFASVCSPALAELDYKEPVKKVGDSRLELKTTSEAGFVPMYASMDWGKPHLDVTRVVVLFHGRSRNADGYFETAKKALAAAHQSGNDTLLLAPQFLAERDAKAHGLDSKCVRWKFDNWEGGDDAPAPPDISSFDVIDALLDQLGNAMVFPRLQQVVLAGHSGGGQILQRHAALGRGGAALFGRGVKVRYVVANPSSYLYFTDDRPNSDGTFGPPDISQFPKFNLWKYGLKNAPRYVQGTAAGIEKAYVSREVIYLLGAADVDPNQSALDKSPAAEAQGANRYARGSAFMRYMQARHPGLSHQLWSVPGVAHEGEKMFTSAQGLAALFDVPPAAK